MSVLPDCREVSHLLSAELDGRRLNWRAHVHLWLCEVCRRARAQFAALGAAVKRAPNSGPGLTETAKERLRRALGGG